MTWPVGNIVYQIFGIVLMVVITILSKAVRLALGLEAGLGVNL